VSVLDVITNKEKTENNEVDIVAPGFSATKIQSLIGAAVLGVLAVVPTQLKEDEQVVIAAIAAGTAILLGMFALWAVDIRARQKAREVALRWGAPEDKPQVFQALPTEALILQKGHSTPEYEVKMAMVEEGSVSLVAARNGELVSATFKQAPKPK
jgi:hypothetical protein